MTVAYFVEGLPITALRGLDVIILTRMFALYVGVAVIFVAAFVMPFDKSDSSDLVILISDNCKTLVYLVSFHCFFFGLCPFCFSRRMPLFLRDAEEPLPRWDYLLANSPSGLQLSRRYSSLQRECVQLLFSKNRGPLKNISEIVF